MLFPKFIPQVIAASGSSLHTLNSRLCARGGQQTQGPGHEVLENSIRDLGGFGPVGLEARDLGGVV